MTAKVRNLDHLNLSVKNFEETAGWYGRVFGFDIVEKGIYNGRPWGVLRAGEAMLCIYEHPDKEWADPDDLSKKGVHAINHFGLRISDKAAWEQTIARENIEVEYGGRAIRWPRSTAWYISDPTGYQIEVVLWDNDQINFVTRKYLLPLPGAAKIGTLYVFRHEVPQIRGILLRLKLGVRLLPSQHFFRVDGF